METVRDLLLLLIFLGAAQGIFLGTAVWGHKRDHRTANRILAVLLIITAIVISNFIFCQTPFHEGFPHFAGLHLPLTYLFGPLFLFYVKALTTPRFRFRKQDLVHAVPVVLCVVYLLPFFFQNGAAKLQSVAEGSSNVDWWATQGLTLLHLFGYLIWVIVLLGRHAEGIKNLFSSIQQINLVWLRNLTAAVLAVWAVNVFVFVRGDYDNPISYIIPLILSLIVYAIGYLGFRQPEIFSSAVAEPAPSNTSSERYATSALTEKQADKYLDRLLQSIDDQKPHLDPDLTLPELAKQLSISTHHLSQVINQRLDQNFFDFVNSYRVEEAKRRLADPRSHYLTIVAIAQEAGFNSKSAFYTAFRKHTGMTPSQFKGTVQGGALAA